MSLRYSRWSVEHPVPYGTTGRARLGDRISACDVIASGAAIGSAVRVAGARHIGIGARDLPGASKVAIGDEVRRGAVLARTGRRFARAAKAPIDGRVMRITDEGDYLVATVLDRWTIRSTLDGVVARSDESAVTVEGAAWCLEGIAAYGPDAIGRLALAVDAPTDGLAPPRIDVRLRGSILVGGARLAAEAISRAHACGVAGLVAGAAPAGGLRVVYGDDVTADGLASRDDRPTVLCLLGFGIAPLPGGIFRALAALAGSRAAIHTASSRLFVFAPPGAAGATDPPPIALADDHGSVRPLEGPAAPAGITRFPSDVEAEAVLTDSGPVPAANILPFDAKR
ncbi:hypothetical protein BH18CHL2_BH18CHL2_12510 [soil metagenome]